MRAEWNIHNSADQTDKNEINKKYLWSRLSSGRMAEEVLWYPKPGSV